MHLTCHLRPHHRLFNTDFGRWPYRTLLRLRTRWLEEAAQADASGMLAQRTKDALVKLHALLAAL